MTHVILFGIDGATYRILGPLIEDGALPSFQELMQDGSYGILESTIPPYSVTAWTSAFTGVNPGKHGLIDSIMKINNKFIVTTSKYREVETIWYELKRKKKQTIITSLFCNSDHLQFFKNLIASSPTIKVNFTEGHG